MKKAIEKFEKLFGKSNDNERIDLGDEVIDTLTGLRGIVVNQYNPSPASPLEMTSIQLKNGKLYHAHTAFFALIKKKEAIESGQII